MSHHARSVVLRRDAPATTGVELSPALALDPNQQGERTIPVVASTEDVDYFREVIDQASWKLERFQLNPVALYQHDRCCEPIGFYRDVRVESGALRATLVLYTDDVSPLAGRIWRRYCAGGPVPLSVGFGCGRTADEERAGVKVRVLYDCELEEISVVTIPANPAAVAVARTKAAALYQRHRAGTPAHTPHRTRTTTMNEFEKYLQAKGMTPEEFQAKAGITADEYAKLVSGEAPDDVTTKAATALEVQLDELLDAILGAQGLDDEGEPLTKAAPKPKTPAQGARRAQAGRAGGEADLVKMLGAKSAADAQVRLQALLDTRDEHASTAARLAKLEAQVQKSATASEASAREAVLEKYRVKGVLTPAREAGKVGKQLAKYKSAAEVESYLDSLEPAVGVGAAARQAEVDASSVKTMGLSEADMAEIARETGLPIEGLTKSAAEIAGRPLVR